jgi:malonate-semialdehyde dehydrogenase (acetylating)/methylmalonate-semialdehyde dehydrogenase
LLEALIPMVEAIRVGPGHLEGQDMGPLISQAHHDRVVAALDQGVAEGATLCIDGRHFQHASYPQCYFIGPSLFDNVTENMSIYQKELFAPALCLVRVATLEDAIDLINRHSYGNGAALFTQDGFTARTFAERVEIGMVGINVPIPVPVASHPFGGWKRSSFGDTNMHGTESIHFYTRRKTITSKWPAKDHRDRSFAMPTHD